METTIRNENLTLTVDSLGAQMLALDSCRTRYLWDGDPAYWEDRAPVLFPFIGRLTEHAYTFEGKRYPMGIHGFAAGSTFTVNKRSETAAEFLLEASEETKKSYPFDFRFSVTYTLRDWCLEVTYRVENRDSKTMPFALGGHPGFRVPFVEGTEFSDYAVTFSQPCQPDRVGFTPAVYLSGVDTPYPLEDGTTLHLSHSLFDEDAIILKNMARQVTLSCEKEKGSITVTYPDMPYLGLWHMPKTDAPYLCIEPWSSLPARQGIVEEFSCKSDMRMLPPGGVYENRWFVTIEE